MPCYRWHWHYHQAKGIGLQLLEDQWVGVACCLGTLAGACGAVLGFSFVPTENFKYMIMERVYTRAVTLGLMAPLDVYVKYALKYHNMVFAIITKFWTAATTKVGQDVRHAIMLLTTCLDCYHPDYTSKSHCPPPPPTAPVIT